MNLEPLQDHIAANTDLVVGTDLFVEGFPATVERGVMLVTEALADPGVDPELRGRMRHRFQVIVRDSNRQQGKQRAEELFWLLNTNIRQTIDGYVFHFIMPRHTPMPFRRSEGDAVEFSINFDTVVDYPNVPPDS